VGVLIVSTSPSRRSRLDISISLREPRLGREAPTTASAWAISADVGFMRSIQTGVDSPPSALRGGYRLNIERSSPPPRETHAPF
jgi:hypothetical protein